MSIITAIFQAIGQALTFVFPLSESGHSAIFHDFSNRFSGSCSELTGLIHIGIAIGLAAAFYKYFLKLIFEFFSSAGELFKKQFDIKNQSNSRRFMLFTFIPYFLMLLYLIPLGGRGNLYRVLQSYSYDKTLLEEGIFFIINAALIFFASSKLAKKEGNKQLGIINAIIAGICVFFAIPLAGFSLSAITICALVLLGTNRKIAFRYFISISVPVLLVGGIIEIASCVTYVTIIVGCIGVVLAGIISFFAGRILLFMLKSNHMKYFSYYNFATGVIISVIGIAELFVR